MNANNIALIRGDQFFRHIYSYELYCDVEFDRRLEMGIKGVSGPPAPRAAGIRRPLYILAHIVDDVRLWDYAEYIFSSRHVLKGLSHRPIDDDRARR